MKNGNAWVVLLVVGALLSGSAIASDKKANREREMLRRAQIELQQAREQSAALEAEKNKSVKELEQVSKSGKAAEAKAARLARELKEEQAQRGQMETELAAAKQRLTELESKVAELTGSLDETRRTLAGTEAAKKNLEGIKTRNEREIALCEDKNKSLYQVGRDLMVRYEKKSCEDALAQREPFTGLKRVEVENLMEEYRDKLDEQKTVKGPGG